jgi:hypothetical protein
MKFCKNSFYINNLGEGPAPNPGKSNPDAAQKRKRSLKQQEVLTSENVRKVALNGQASYDRVVYVRGMCEKKVKRELFLKEFEEGFELKSLKGKTSEVIRSGSDELKEKFYECGVEGKLPATWEKFKEFVTDFCTEQSLFSFVKYHDEKWFDYCRRIKDWAVLRGQSDEEIMKKLRTEKLPRKLEIVLYSVGVSFNDALERIKEYEENIGTEYTKETINIKPSIGKTELNNRKTFERKCFKCGKFGHLQFECRKQDISKIKCFNCGKMGHYSTSCTENKPSNNINVEMNNVIDERFIKLNGKILKAVFDTGASMNMICSGALKNMKNVNVKPIEKDYFYFDGGSNKTKGIVNLELEYEGKKSIEEFNIVDRKQRDMILLSNNTVGKICRVIDVKMPVECCIDTKESKPISWNRPIRSLKDKHDFEKLLKKLESEDVIEDSTSMWLNPVVLTRKKKWGFKVLC